MFLVSTSKIYDKLEMKQFKWDSTADFISLIPSKQNSQLHIFKHITFENTNQKTPSIVDFQFHVYDGSRFALF